MNWFTIVLLVLLIIFLAIIFLQIRINIVYENSPTIYLKVLFFKIKVSPIDNSRKKTFYKLPKKENEPKPKPLTEDEQKKKNIIVKIIKAKGFSEFFGFLGQLLSLIKLLIVRIGSRFVIKNCTLFLSVSSADPCKTAIDYSKACAIVSSFQPFLIKFVKQKNLKIRIVPNFINSKNDVYFNITIGFRIFWILLHGIHSAIKFIKIWIAISKDLD